MYSDRASVGSNPAISFAQHFQPLMQHSLALKATFLTYLLVGPTPTSHEFYPLVIFQMNALRDLSTIIYSPSFRIRI